jgi:hypothetical protein
MMVLIGVVLILITGIKDFCAFSEILKGSLDMGNQEV